MGHLLFAALAIMYPSQTPKRERQREATILPEALNHCRSRARFNVSRLNVEKVVNPPHNPAIINCRKAELTRTLPSGPVKVAKNPMNEQPSTVTKSVPHGNVSPICRAEKPYRQ